jgi:hypothetical protein
VQQQLKRIDYVAIIRKGQLLLKEKTAATEEPKSHPREETTTTV